MTTTSKNLRNSVDETRIARALALAERGPAESELRAAPIMRNWFPLEYSDEPGVVRLSGLMTGCGGFASDRITTAPIIAVQSGFRWALSLNSWYWIAISPDSYRPERPLKALPVTDDLRETAQSIEAYYQLLARGGGRPLHW